MLRKDQANAVIDTLLAQQRAKHASRWTLNRYSYSELQRLEPKQRSQVVREATRNINRNWRITLGLLGWSTAYWAVWLFLMPAGDQRASLGVFILGATLPPLFLRAWFVRREIGKILRSRTAQTDVDRM